MLRFLFHTSSRAVASATLFAVGLLVAGAPGPAQADPIEDPVGDFLPTYTGPQLPGMDVVDHQVTLRGDRVIFFGRMAGPIAPTQAIGGLYLFGMDRGQGTPRFLGGTPQIGPNVLWDLIVVVNPLGIGRVNNQVAGVVTLLNPADINIHGNEFTASVPLSVLLPAATRPPQEWTYNLWPRNSTNIGQNVAVSDLAPDDGNSLVQTVPDVACATDSTEIWPPDHRMVEVGVFIEAMDAFTDPADLVLLEATVASDEPDDAEGDGNTTGDAHGEDGFTAPVDATDFFAFNPVTNRFEGVVFLRAERAGGGDGRTYTIEATVLNSHNNWATSRCVVVVPLDQSE